MKDVIKKDGQYIKHYLGAYKYAMTQTFAIPTIDDAEKDKYTTGSEDNDNNNDENTNVTTEGSLNENNIEEILGNPDVTDFEKIFDLAV